MMVFRIEYGNLKQAEDGPWGNPEHGGTGKTGRNAAAGARRVTGRSGEGPLSARHWQERRRAALGASNEKGLMEHEPPSRRTGIRKV